MSHTPLTQRPVWTELKSLYANLKDDTLRQLFAADPQRGERMTLEACGVYLDYSKHRIDASSLSALFRLAAGCDLQQHIEAMFTGQKINTTEQRAVLHTALRAPASATVMVDGENVVPLVHHVLARMSAFSDQVRSGAWKGAHGQAHPQYRQYRHRWIRPRPGDGL